MGIRKTLTSILAASMLWSTPLLAQDDPITEPNEVLEEEEVEEDYIFTAGRSAVVGSARLEVPEALEWDFMNLALRHNDYYFGLRGPTYRYGDRHIQSYFRNIDEERILIGELTLREVRQSSGQIQPFLQDTQQAFGDLVGDLGRAVEGRAFILGLDFYGFFQEVLPGYIEDDIISPREAAELTTIVGDKFEEVYNEDLTDQEREDIQTAIDDYSREMNDIFSKYTIDETLRLLLSSQNPAEHISIGGVPLETYLDMLIDLEPILYVDVTDTSFLVQGDFEARLSQDASMYSSFQLKHGVFRTSYRNGHEGMLKGSIHAQGQLLPGTRLIDVINGNSEDAVISEDQYALLTFVLGYDPTFVDSVAAGRLNAQGYLNAFHQLGYEQEGDFSFFTLGTGISPGWKTRQDFSANASFSGSVNSIENSIESELHARITNGVERTFSLLPYAYAKLDQDFFWHHVYAGVLQDYTQRKETVTTVDFVMREKFFGEGETTFDWKEESTSSNSMSFRPILQYHGGLSLGWLSPYMAMSGLDERMTFGGILNSPFIFSHGSMSYNLERSQQSYVYSGHAILPTLWMLNTQAANDFMFPSIQLNVSPFPGREAMQFDLSQQYYGQLEGVFLEGRAESLDDRYFPHDTPQLAHLGLIAGTGTGYFLRAGTILGQPQEVQGYYVNLGSDAMSILAQGKEEIIDLRNNRAFSGTLASQVNLTQSMSVQLRFDTLIAQPYGSENGFSARTQPNLIYSVVLTGQDPGKTLSDITGIFY